MEEGVYFTSDSLGKRKPENGIYAEGTWNNGEFVYGLNFGEAIPMTFFEKRQRKKLYGSSSAERIYDFLRGGTFLAVPVVFLVKFNEFGFLGLAVAAPFGIAGVLILRSALKKTKQARENDQ